MLSDIRDYTEWELGIKHVIRSGNKRIEQGVYYELRHELLQPQLHDNLPNAGRALPELPVLVCEDVRYQEERSNLGERRGVDWTLHSAQFDKLLPRGNYSLDLHHPYCLAGRLDSLITPGQLLPCSRPLCHSNDNPLRVHCQKTSSQQ